MWHDILHGGQSRHFQSWDTGQNWLWGWILAKMRYLCINKNWNFYFVNLFEFFHIFYKTFTKLIYLREKLSVLYIKSIGNGKIHSTLRLFYSTSDSCAMLTSKIHNLVQEWAMKLGFGPKYFFKCVLTDSVNNSILKKIDFGLNGPDRVTYRLDQCNYFL